MPSALDRADPLIALILEREDARQRQGLELIGSENFTSPAVREAVGSVLMNKYAEGYPGRRYYGGCEVVDEAETYAIQRGKHLFGAEHINVQPHDGSGANRAAYRAAGLRPSRKEDLSRDVLLSLGGGVEHLTHGKGVNASGQDHDVHHFGLLRDSLDIDVDEAARLAQQYAGRMKVLMCGHSSYPKAIPAEVFAKLAQIAKDAGAKFIVDMAHFAGLVAGRVHDSPVPHADFVTSTSHKTLRGPRAGFVLSKTEHAKALDSAVFPQLQGGPHMHVIAGKAVAFHEALQPAFRKYAEQIIANTRAMAMRLRRNGAEVWGGGDDANHLLLLDVTANNGPSGKVAETALNNAHLTVNKNMIPFDPRKPMDPSGIRVGTPAVTSRGMRETEMEQIADWMTTVIRNPEDKEVQNRIRSEVEELTRHFAMPGDDEE